ncbi:hypothetical protein PKB_2466 [Pseudomonas knackmussii B13]|uniref:Secreted protein n=1 Tax=Pseudomonas knackmussii (strain DSM 6978 / CCUG 54928 / LMG 23759 / B13) TaxID=1301098 RepID=A0A024HH84_PSEKB|nr:hypothetical protein [Pseudomonas knackmussii]CDF83813.1 hypothetical protein PKB_2466 [Pseudomonas knackmussii B13]
MRSLISNVAFIAMVMGTAAGPALAESGGDRVFDSHLGAQPLAAQEQPSDSAQRFAQMVEAQPTAAGPISAMQDADDVQYQAMQPPTDRALPHYATPIERDRDIYGTPK